MADQQLRRETVDNLAQKLDEFSEVLTIEERAVLLGLLGVASSTISKGHEEVESEGGVIEGRGSVNMATATVPRLSSALRESFTRLPRTSGGGIGDPSGPVSDSVGVGVSSVSWSKDYNRELGSGVSRPGGIARPSSIVNIPGVRTIR